MATLAICRTLAGEDAQEWLWGSCRPKCVVRRLGFERQLPPEQAITQCEAFRQQRDRYPQFSWHVGLYESRSPFTLGRIENYRKPDETLCQYAECKMVANVAAVPIAGEILIGQHRGSDDATSNCFIRAVLPTWVVFPPAMNIAIPPIDANRLTAIGIDSDKILRADR